ncbi:MAG: hypothetical protein HQL30_08030 [Candidatus Omnitrophica bacterium]|nr:hypothetical protein [Candidatus Omnitrophota bacterium]
MEKMVKSFISVITALGFLVNSTIGELAWAGPSLPILNSSVSAAKGLDPEMFSLPEYLGQVKGRFRGASSGKTVIYIQDAHCNYECQKKISDIIEYVAKEYNVSVINLEGGSKGYDLSIFESIEDPGTREWIADQLVREGLVNGAESFAIDQPGKVRLWGVEDVDLYLSNLAVYKDSLKNKKEIDKGLETLSGLLNSIKTKIYTQELLEFDSKYSGYKSGDIEFRDYLSYLISRAASINLNMDGFPNVNKVNTTMSLEKNIDFNAVNKQRDRFLDKLSDNLSRKNMDEIALMTIALKKNELPDEKYYSCLFDKAKTAGVGADEFPELAKYMEYITVYSGTDRNKIMDEMARMEEAVMDKLCVNDDQRTLNKLAGSLALTKNIFGLSLTKNDYKYYLGNKRSFSADNYLMFFGRMGDIITAPADIGPVLAMIDESRVKMEKFFEYSFKRDEAFLRNISQAPAKAVPESAHEASILVTGGFHTENLETLFESGGISYVSIMPNFRNDEGYESPYFRLLAGGESPIIKPLMPAESLIQLATHLDSAISVEIYKDYGVSSFQMLVALLRVVERGPAVVEGLDGKRTIYEKRGGDISIRGLFQGEQTPESMAVISIRKIIDEEVGQIMIDGVIDSLEEGDFSELDEEKVVEPVLRKLADLKVDKKIIDEIRERVTKPDTAHPHRNFITGVNVHLNHAGAQGIYIDAVGTSFPEQQTLLLHEIFASYGVKHLENIPDDEEIDSLTPDRTAAAVGTVNSSKPLWVRSDAERAEMERDYQSLMKGLKRLIRGKASDDKEYAAERLAGQFLPEADVKRISVTDHGEKGCIAHVEYKPLLADGKDMAGLDKNTSDLVLRPLTEDEKAKIVKVIGSRKEITSPKDQVKGLLREMRDKRREEGDELAASVLGDIIPFLKDLIRDGNTRSFFVIEDRGGLSGSGVLNYWDGQSMALSGEFLKGDLNKLAIGLVGLVTGAAFRRELPILRKGERAGAALRGLYRHSGAAEREDLVNRIMGRIERGGSGGGITATGYLRDIAFSRRSVHFMTRKELSDKVLPGISDDGKVNVSVGFVPDGFVADGKKRSSGTVGGRKVYQTAREGKNGTTTAATIKAISEFKKADRVFIDVVTPNVDRYVAAAVALGYVDKKSFPMARAVAGFSQTGVVPDGYKMSQLLKLESTISYMLEAALAAENSLVTRLTLENIGRVLGDPSVLERSPEIWKSGLYLDIEESEWAVTCTENIDGRMSFLDTTKFDPGIPGYLRGKAFSPSTSFEGTTTPLLVMKYTQYSPVVGEDTRSVLRPVGEGYSIAVAPGKRAVDLEPLWALLNAAEQGKGRDLIGEGWGGHKDRGGSPRSVGTKLTESEVRKIVTSYLDTRGTARHGAKMTVKEKDVRREAGSKFGAENLGIRETAREGRAFILPEEMPLDEKIEIISSMLALISKKSYKEAAETVGKYENNDWRKLEVLFLKRGDFIKVALGSLLAQLRQLRRDTEKGASHGRVLGAVRLAVVLEGPKRALSDNIFLTAGNYLCVDIAALAYAGRKGFASTAGAALRSVLERASGKKNVRRLVAPATDMGEFSDSYERSRKTENVEKKFMTSLDLVALGCFLFSLSAYFVALPIPGVALSMVSLAVTLVKKAADIRRETDDKKITLWAYLSDWRNGAGLDKKSFLSKNIFAAMLMLSKLGVAIPVPVILVGIVPVLYYSFRNLRKNLNDTKAARNRKILTVFSNSLSVTATALLAGSIAIELLVSSGGKGLLDSGMSSIGTIKGSVDAFVTFFLNVFSYSVFSELHKSRMELVEMRYNDELLKRGWMVSAMNNGFVEADTPEEIAWFTEAPNDDFPPPITAQAKKYLEWSLRKAIDEGRDTMEVIGVARPVINGKLRAQGRTEMEDADFYNMYVLSLDLGEDGKEILERVRHDIGENKNVFSEEVTWNRLYDILRAKNIPDGKIQKLMPLIRSSYGERIRKDGSLFYQHALETAVIYAENAEDAGDSQEENVIVALLHDSLERGTADFNVLRKALAKAGCAKATADRVREISPVSGERKDREEGALRYAERLKASPVLQGIVLAEKAQNISDGWKLFLMRPEDEREYIRKKLKAGVIGALVAGRDNVPMKARLLGNYIDLVILTGEYDPLLEEIISAFVKDNPGEAADMVEAKFRALKEFMKYNSVLNAILEKHMVQPGYKLHAGLREAFTDGMRRLALTQYDDLFRKSEKEVSPAEKIINDFMARVPKNGISTGRALADPLNRTRLLNVGRDVIEAAGKGKRLVVGEEDIAREIKKELLYDGRLQVRSDKDMDYSRLGVEIQKKMKGDLIAEAGKQSDTGYLILEGGASFFYSFDDDISGGELFPGNTVSFTSARSGRPASATVKAGEKGATVLKIPKAALDQMIRNVPGLEAGLDKTSALRAGARREAMQIGVDNLDLIQCAALRKIIDVNRGMVWDGDFRPDGKMSKVHLSFSSGGASLGYSQLIGLVDEQDAAGYDPEGLMKNYGVDKISVVTKIIKLIDSGRLTVKVGENTIDPKKKGAVRDLERVINVETCREDENRQMRDEVLFDERNSRHIRRPAVIFDEQEKAGDNIGRPVRDVLKNSCDIFIDEAVNAGFLYVEGSREIEAVKEMIRELIDSFYVKTASGRREAFKRIIFDTIEVMVFQQGGAVTLDNGTLWGYGSGANRLRGSNGITHLIADCERGKALMAALRTEHSDIMDYLPLFYIAMLWHDANTASAQEANTGSKLWAMGQTIALKEGHQTAAIKYLAERKDDIEHCFGNGAFKRIAAIMKDHDTGKLSFNTADETLVSVAGLSDNSASEEKVIEAFTKVPGNEKVALKLNYLNSLFGDLKEDPEELLSPLSREMEDNIARAESAGLISAVQRNAYILAIRLDLTLLTGRRALDALGMQRSVSSAAVSDGVLAITHTRSPDFEALSCMLGLWTVQKRMVDAVSEYVPGVDGNADLSLQELVSDVEGGGKIRKLIFKVESAAPGAPRSAWAVSIREAFLLNCRLALETDGNDLKAVARYFALPELLVRKNENAFRQKFAEHREDIVARLMSMLVSVYSDRDIPLKGMGEDLLAVMPEARLEITDDGIFMDRASKIDGYVYKALLNSMETIYSRRSPDRKQLWMDFNWDAGRQEALNIVPPGLDADTPVTYNNSEERRVEIMSGYAAAIKGNKAPFHIDHHYGSAILTLMSTTVLAVDLARYLHDNNGRDILEQMKNGIFFADHCDADILLANFVARHADDAGMLNDYGDLMKETALMNDHAKEPREGVKEQAEILKYIMLGLEKKLSSGEVDFNAAMEIIKEGLALAGKENFDALQRKAGKDMRGLSPPWECFSLGYRNSLDGKRAIAEAVKISGERTKSGNMLYAKGEVIVYESSASNVDTVRVLETIREKDADMLKNARLILVTYKEGDKRFVKLRSFFTDRNSEGYGDFVDIKAVTDGLSVMDPDFYKGSGGRAMAGGIAKNGFTDNDGEVLRRVIDDVGKCVDNMKRSPGDASATVTERAAQDVEKAPGKINVREEKDILYADLSLGSAGKIDKGRDKWGLDEVVRALSSETMYELNNNLFHGEKGVIAIGIPSGEWMEANAINGVKARLNHLLLLAKKNNITVDIFEDTPENREDRKGKYSKMKGRVVTIIHRGAEDNNEKKEMLSEWSYPVFLSGADKVPEGTTVVTPVIKCFRAGIEALNVLDINYKKGTPGFAVDPDDQKEAVTRFVNAAWEISGTEFNDPMPKEEVIKRILEKGLASVILTVDIRPVDTEEIAEFHEAEQETLRSL